MSNRLTFSLASLVLIIGLVFVTAPAMAQIDQVVYIGDTADAPTGADTIDAIDIAVIEGHSAIPANGHLVIYKGSDLAASGLPAALPTGAVTARWENMPDLEEVFFGNAGGTIALKATKTALDGTTLVGDDYRAVDHDNDDTDNNDNKETTAGTDDDPIVAATPDRDVAVNDAAITEIMWGLDNSTAGSGDEENRQWIEIHNRLSVELPINGLISTPRA